RWLERRGRKTPNVSLAAVPLDLAPILKENLFDRVETVVLTSATLAAGGDFGFLEQRVGLDLPPSRVRAREIHASPFDFPAQCLFGIPTDLPEPRDDEPGHDAAVARVLVELAHASDGGMFVLFTSHGALRRAAEAVRGAIGGRWPPPGQGDGPCGARVKSSSRGTGSRRPWARKDRLCSWSCGCSKRRQARRRTSSGPTGPTATGRSCSGAAGARASLIRSWRATSKSPDGS